MVFLQNERQFPKPTSETDHLLCFRQPLLHTKNCLSSNLLLSEFSLRTRQHIPEPICENDDSVTIIKQTKVINSVQKRNFKTHIQSDDVTYFTCTNWNGINVEMK